MHGTLQVSDTLASLAQSNSPQTVAQFGVAETFALIDGDLQYHNTLVNGELIPDLCTRTDQREEVYGTREDMTVEEIDEYGRPDVQKTGFAALMGFPLSSYGRSVGWTWDYMQVASVSELAKQYTAMRTADLRGIKVNILRRFFNPTNNLNYRDAKLDRRNLKLYGFHNADGMQVYTGPNGETFDGTTHSHFTATLTLTAAAVQSVITNVLEHGRVGQLVLYINRTEEAGIRAMTNPGDFTPYIDARIRQSLTATFVEGQALDLDNPADREIGTFGPAVVSVKPWVPSSYFSVIDKGDAMMKPLAYRTRPGGVFADFGLRAKHRNEDFPLYADTLARDYGIGVWHRHMAAAHMIGSTTYAAPNI